MTGNSAWLWIVPVIFAVVILVWITSMFWLDRRRNTHGNDLQPKTSSGKSDPLRGPMQGGIMENDKAHRGPGHVPGDTVKQKNYDPGP